ncbi:MAG: hypothetical protein NZ926_00345 [Candidatus Methanomethylicia archaeon]|nr:hypothetical protein [Candidatus Methanomethylicia archaeon]MCX8168885.1 hypothetical protein [Candidatus Methanomethylicia archaeon]MDW7988617.1 hypothetical protein [Nitrososphaerota archaeon]
MFTRGIFQVSEALNMTEIPASIFIINYNGENILLVSHHHLQYL